MKNSHVTCPFCKSELEADAQACEVCGRSLSDAIGIPPVKDEVSPIQELAPFLFGTSKPDQAAPVEKAAPVYAGFGNYPTESRPASPRQIFILVGAVLAVACLMVIGGAMFLQFVMTQINERGALASQTAQVLAREAERTTVAAEQTQAWDDYKVRSTEQALGTQTAFSSQALRSEGLSWPIILEDTFSTDFGTWYIEEGEDDFSIFSYQLQDGAYRLEMTAKSGVSQWMWPDVVDTSMESFYLAADLRMSGPDSMDGGLIFHLSDEDDNAFYLFDITRSGEFAVFVHSPSDWTLLVDYQFTDVILPNAANRIEIIGRPSADGSGRTYDFFINGEWVAILQDSALEGGWFGVQVGLSDEGDQGTWIFDNIVLRVP